MKAAGRLRRFAGRFWLVVLVVLLWEAGARAAGKIDFPAPSLIVARMRELWLSGPPSRLFLSDDTLSELLPGLGRMFTGWLLASLLGVVAGVALGRSAVASHYVEPLLHFGRAIPPPLLITPFVLVFRSSTQTQLAVIVFGVIWPVLLNAMEGARSVDRGYLDTAAVFGLRRHERLLRVVLPAAAPKIFAGLRLSLSLALILMVISELVGSDGIGYQLLVAQRNFDSPGVWGTILLLGVLGYALNSLFVVVERHVPGTRRSGPGRPETGGVT
ncbi:ABC transporter permease [Sinosporangium siamense]|uniref:Nitrate ABC transporter permease n=1 Tax=Sinosporangium siamense TaxID=1367973 RepID=A0A919RCI1_9ACTN|nr:ABC transporter permease [Sinosporangium siamense]GII91416.1 nitrate ABC transporter permease [Sinosporangium siamense]